MFYEEDDFPMPEGATLRPNDDGTVTLITSSGGEHTYDPEQVFRNPDIPLPE